MSLTDETPALEQLHAYHQLTKHRFDGYAPGPQTLDWDDQPNVFRHFEGAPRITLPLERAEQVLDAKIPASAIHSGRLAPQPLSIDTLSCFLRYAAGLTAWKVFGPDRWSQRTNPSSGNLHPSELYLVLPACADWDAGIYHYDVHDHALEQRLALAADQVSGVSLILTSVLQREAWKYGERGLRYCLLDSGHLLAQCQVAAALLGWQWATVRTDHTQIAALAGIARPEFAGVEPEYPELLLSLNGADVDYVTLAELCSESDLWQGQPSKLGPRPLERWRECEAVINSFTESPAITLAESPSLEIAVQSGACNAIDTIMQRRSAQAYDHQYVLSTEQIGRLLHPLMPGQSRLQTTDPRLHLLLFVHNVESLEPGLYLLPRTTQAADSLVSAASKWPEGRRVEFAGLELVHLKTANTRKAAAQLCCNQMIAAASSMTLMMLAEYDSALAAGGSNAYQQLFYEAGILGQSLYLSASAQGLNGTGIGCFFDDGVHELLGLKDQSYQAVYGFAVGAGKHDDRIAGLSGYHHLHKE